MTRLFDPIRTRQNFERFLLKAELSMTAQGRPNCGAAAIVRLNTMVSAWLRESIVAGEDLGDVHIPAVRRRASALSHWMLTNENDAVTLAASLEEFDDYFARGGRKMVDPDFFNKETQRFEPIIQRGLPIADSEILDGYLSAYLASCIESGQFARGMSLYEKVGGKVGITAAQINTIAEFGYWVCCERMRGDLSTATYLSVGERCLKMYLQDRWLGCGHGSEAASWLKVVYWHSGVTTQSVETVLRAYELMPDVPRPAFVPCT